MRKKLPSYEEIVKAALEVFKQYDTKLTLRQLYYRLVSNHLFSNTLNNYKRLSRIMVKAREQGDAPISCLEDRSRRILGRGDTEYESAEEFLARKLASLQDSWKSYTMPMWNDQQYNVVVSLEKGALSRLVSKVANMYSVRTFPTRGYPSFTYVQRMASYIRKRLKGKQTVVIYFGDFDPSGIDIERDLTERLNRYKAGNFKVRRIALTREQILKYNLPPMPVKKSDARTPSFIAAYGNEAVELDALGPDILQHLVAEAIEDYIYKEAWIRQLKEIESIKQWIKEKLKNIEDIVP